LSSCVDVAFDLDALLWREPLEDDGTVVVLCVA
jgi:hypothetical protein